MSTLHSIPEEVLANARTFVVRRRELRGHEEARRKAIEGLRDHAIRSIVRQASPILQDGTMLAFNALSVEEKRKENVRFDAFRLVLEATFDDSDVPLKKQNGGTSVQVSPAQSARTIIEMQDYLDMINEIHNSPAHEVNVHQLTSDLRHHRQEILITMADDRKGSQHEDSIATLWFKEALDKMVEQLKRSPQPAHNPEHADNLLGYGQARVKAYTEALTEAIRRHNKSVLDDDKVIYVFWNSAGKAEAKMWPEDNSREALDRAAERMRYTEHGNVPGPAWHLQTLRACQKDKPWSGHQGQGEPMVIVVNEADLKIMNAHALMVPPKEHRR